MKPYQPVKTELLAPAGSLESFFAALESGADAVYCGLQDFSARAKAKNFSLSDMARMTAYAKGMGRKLYVPLNTLVKEAELTRLVEVLGALEEMGIDAVILQDLSVWRLIRDHFPGLKLHSSTQMTVHNAAGVNQLESMGFERAVLARELSLEEIRVLRRNSRIELEHFIHGALCFSFSGQCYFSSWLGGKSGNRGRCAQPCRRRYSYRQKPGYYFSTNDLSALDHIQELAQAGVVSFKIEGRMKSAEYVATVVGAYRRVMDASEKKRAEAIALAKEDIKNSFGRRPTKGFLLGGPPADIAMPSAKGATGQFLGELAQVKGKDISFKTKVALLVGDRLRIQPRTDEAGTAFTVKTLLKGEKRTAEVVPGTFVTVPSPFPGKFKPGDAVFKVSSREAFTLSDSACRKRLSQAPAKALGVRLAADLFGSTLLLRAEAAGRKLEKSFEIETFPALNHPLSEEVLQEAFEKTGHAGLRLEAFSCGTLPEVVIPPSLLKQVRRDFYALVEEQVISNRHEERRRREQAAIRSLSLPPARSSGRQQLCVAIAQARDLHILKDPAVDRVVVPLTPENLREAQTQAGRLGERRQHVEWDLPFILWDSEAKAYRSALEQLVASGYRCFRLNNLGHFPLFEGLENVQLHAGYRLFCLNSQAMQGWGELGASSLCLYPEDDRENLRELLSKDAGPEPELMVYGSIPLIVSRIPIKDVRPISPVLSDRGDAYRVEGRGGLTILRSETDFSWLGKVAELRQLGARRFLIDLTHLGPFSVRGKQVLDAWKKGRDLPGTSVFNFDMGME